MSQTTSTPQKKFRKPNRRQIAGAALVIFIWLGASGVFGPLFGKLSSVQENNNSAFLPDSAESTEAAKIIAKFSSTANAQLPALVLLEGSVDRATLAKINAYVQTLPNTHIQYLKEYKGTFDTGIALSKYLSPGVPLVAFPSTDGKAILINLPITYSGAGINLADGKPILTAMIHTIRTDMNAWAKAHGFVSHVTGIAALYSDLFGAFGGIDSSLLLTTLGVVAFILILVYRSPVLWVLPLLSAVFALSTAGGIIYILAKHHIIALNGQSQGILSVLVLGAATDYALLLIARYREELHRYESRFDAMRAAYRGIFEPILASGSTVALSLLVLLLSNLSSNRGLGPVGAIGIASAMLTILTLLPAMLVTFGRWIFWPRIPHFDGVDSQLSGVWSKVGQSVSKRPRRLWITTALGLLVLAGFSTTLQTNGLSTSQSFTTRPESVVGQELLLKHFSGGQGQPTEVVVKLTQVKQVIDVLLRIPGINSVQPYNDPGVLTTGMGPQVKVVDGQVILDATLSQAPDSVGARRLVPIIRAAVHKMDPAILVGGTSAVYYDVDQASSRDKRVIIPIVLLLIAVILSLLLRSLVASGLLLLSVILSYTATLGVCQLVFHNIFHFPGADTAFPLFVFIFHQKRGIKTLVTVIRRIV